MLAPLLCALLLAVSCGRAGAAIDPGDWGFGVEVKYNALGGVIEQRGVRTTYYAPESYLFKPSGSVGMLTTPVKSGWLLAGWYTDVTEETGADGAVRYVFAPEDRWDFEFDRVTEDTTLYAYWVPTSYLYYVNPQSDAVSSLYPEGPAGTVSRIVVTKPSEIAPLGLISGYTPAGYSFFGYFEDAACTVPYDFSDTGAVVPVPADADIFSEIAEEIPGILVPLDEWLAEHPEDAESAEPADASGDGEYAEQNDRDPFRFIELAGWKLTDTSDETVLAVRNLRSAIIARNIEEFNGTWQLKSVYLKFIEGDFKRVDSVSDLTEGLSGHTDGYILARDLDFAGISLSKLGDEFTGKFYGGGHTIKNLTLTVTSPKRPIDQTDGYGLWKTLSGAAFYDVSFVDCTVEISQTSDSSMLVGFLSGTAGNVTVSGCTFDNLLFRTGKGEFKPLNLAAGREAVVGDLFAEQSGCSAPGTEFDASYQLEGTVRRVGGLMIAIEPEIFDESAAD
ncbi:MAG: InlB B-repeat-containing protein [Oscillospiraceae bacterium]|nr:InlB B-repeat-containing protein [Oscillospiraceae bacterium]